MSNTYHLQLTYVFDRPIEEPAWYWQPRDEETPFGEEEDALIAFEFFERLCVQPGKDLAPYSDSQVGLGLSYLFDGSVCNLTHGFKAAPVSYERKERAVRALFALFREVFEPRCPEKAAAGSREKSTPLSYICYMFWDVCPLSSWLKHDHAKVEIKPPKDMVADVQRQYQNMDAQTRGYYKAIANVMGRCLELNNPACVESGLHGLGEMAFFMPAIAVPIIDAYLKKGKNQPAALLNYARAARTGMIE